MKELLIIGAGPAGLTAAVYACRQNIDFRIIAENLGGQAALSSRIENYTGFQMVTGEQLIEKFQNHVNEFGVEVKEGVKVTEIKEENGGYGVVTSDGECCGARALLLATGSIPKKLGIPGEDEFLNRGVAYCAVCDAPVFRGKKAAVIGGGNSALDAARQLSDIATSVHMITIEEKMGGEAKLKDKVLSSSNVEVITGARTVSFSGDRMLETIKYEKNGREEDLEVRGAFIEIGWKSSSDYINLVEKNEKGEIMIDCNNRTSRKGIFAAGDVSNISKKQVIIAAGEGAKAALNAIDYIAGKKE